MAEINDLGQIRQGIADIVLPYAVRINPVLRFLQLALIIEFLCINYSRLPAFELAPLGFSLVLLISLLIFYLAIRPGSLSIHEEGLEHSSSWPFSRRFIPWGDIRQVRIRGPYDKNFIFRGSVKMIFELKGGLKPLNVSLNRYIDSRGMGVFSSYLILKAQDADLDPSIEDLAVKKEQSSTVILAKVALYLIFFWYLGTHYSASFFR